MLRNSDQITSQLNDQSVVLKTSVGKSPTRYIIGYACPCFQRKPILNKI